MEKEHYDYNELIRLRNQLEKKKLQFEKHLSDYTNAKEKDEDKIFEYDEVNVDGEEVCDDLLHYINVIKQSSTEEEIRKNSQRKKERKKERNIRWKPNDQNSTTEREEYQWTKKLIWKNYILKR